MAHPFSPLSPLSGPATKKRTIFVASLRRKYQESHDTGRPASVFSEFFKIIYNFQKHFPGSNRAVPLRLFSDGKNSADSQ